MSIDRLARRSPEPDSMEAQLLRSALDANATKGWVVQLYEAAAPAEAQGRCPQCRALLPIHFPSCPEVPA